MANHMLGTLGRALAAGVSLLLVGGAADSAYAASTAPTCPAGLAFSRPDRACISTQTPTCSRPSRWDPARKGCFPETAATCPGGYIFERGGTMCRPQTIPPGSSVATVAPHCPSGYTLSGRICRSSTSSPPSCQSGYAYNSRRGLCVKSQQATCPAGYRLDAVRGLCSTGPVNQ